MPAKKHMRSNAKKPKEISLDAIRRVQESRMQEIRAAVAEGPGAVARLRYFCGPFWNRAGLRLIRGWDGLP